MSLPGESKNIVSPFDLIEIIDFNYEPRFKDQQFLHEQYVLKKKTCQEIADKICSSRSTVHKYLHEFGIETRERSYVKKSSNTVYGVQIRNYRKVEVAEEQMRIRDMEKLQQQGYSYRKIAELLNALDVATKSGNAKWSGKTVHQTLNRSK